MTCFILDTNFVENLVFARFEKFETGDLESEQIAANLTIQINSYYLDTIDNLHVINFHRGLKILYHFPTLNNFVNEVNFINPTSISKFWRFNDSKLPMGYSYTINLFPLNKFL